MKNQLSPPRLTTSCAVPTASARVSNTHWMAQGEQNWPWKSAEPVEWVMNSFFFSLATVCTARPTAETGTSTIRSTCSVSYQRRARLADVGLQLMVADDH